MRELPAPHRSRPHCAGRRLLLGCLLVFAACGQPDVVDGSQRAVVYQGDDRQEYFELADGRVKSRLSSSIVALIPRAALGTSAAGVRLHAPSWSERAKLCPEQRFAAQSTAAFCSGVLVDRDLVLTSGHCTRVIATDDFVVAFGYYLQGGGELVVANDDLFEIGDIVAERLDPAGQNPRLDFAWLRLRTTPQPPRAPAPIRLSARAPERGDQLVALSAVGGTPIKADVGGTVFDPRPPMFDYFVANTDTAAGSSGGGAFDPGLNLLGILARGGNDYGEPPGRSCVVHAMQPASRDPEEEFTYASAALRDLCAKDPGASSLCRDDCGDPCVALPPEGGCAFVPSRRPGGLWAAGILAVVLLGVRRRGTGLAFSRATAHASRRTLRAGGVSEPAGTSATRPVPSARVVRSPSVK